MPPDPDELAATATAEPPARVSSRIDPHELVAGATIGRYRIVDRLGAGGMGVVFRANDPSLDREVAIKLLRGASTPERIQRLVREAQAMARLSHENLVVVHDAGQDGDRVFLAMELVEGETLRGLFAAEPSWRRRLAAVTAAGAGLAAAHHAGIVHRDFKPENVLVDRRGRVKVADFGLARAEASASTVPSGNAALTQTGSVLGTPAYMAPEQHAGEPVDARVDQFALAVVAWEAIWGERPFRAESYESLAAAVRSGAIDSPPKLRGAPARLEAVLRRALAVSPDERFASIDALLGALVAAQRPRRLPYVAALGAILVAIGGAIVWWRAPKPETAAHAARAAEIRTAVEAYRPSLLACFSSAPVLRRHGAVSISFEVDAGGKVQQISISHDDFVSREDAESGHELQASTQASTEVGRCVAKAALDWKFPPGEPITITTPFVFSK